MNISLNSEYTKTQTDVSDFANCNKSLTQVTSISPLHQIVQIFLLVALAGLEGHLQYLVSEPVAVQTRDGHGRLLVVSHGNEAKALALVGVEVTDHLDIVDRTEGPKQLPEHTLIRIWGQVVHKDAPASARVPRDVHANQAGHAVNGDGGEPERRGRVGGNVGESRKKGREKRASFNGAG